jgi:hypothetical protein
MLKYALPLTGAHKNQSSPIARSEPMKNLTKPMIATVLFALPTFGLACEYPERPTLPDGGSASKEQMIAAQSSVKAFLAAVDEYLNCIEQEEKDAIAALPEINESDEDALQSREAEIKRRDDLLAKRFDAANEEKFLFGEKWNQQVRAYNDRKAEQKPQ